MEDGEQRVKAAESVIRELASKIGNMSVDEANYRSLIGELQNQLQEANHKITELQRQLDAINTQAEAEAPAAKKK